MSFEKIIEGLLKIPAPEKADFTGAKKVALYDFNGTLASDIRGAGMEKYGSALKNQLSVIEKIDGDKISGAFARHGIKLQGSILGKAVARAVWDLAREPPRGTKAREAYYDLLELWVRRGEAGVSVFPDVLKKGNAIDRDKKEGLEVISLSRGPQGMLEVILKVSGLDSVVSRIYSTIPYGGEKSAECYYRFMLDLLKEGKTVAKAYEDETGNLEGLLAADIALAEKMALAEVPYEIIWVDRKGECGEGEGRRAMAEFEEAYERSRKKAGWGKGFKQVFRVTDSLE